MAQNFWISIFAWITCFGVTIPVSLGTEPHSDARLEGLVHGLSKLPRDLAPWYRRPVPLAVIVAVTLLFLNLAFR